MRGIKYALSQPTWMPQYLGEVIMLFVMMPLEACSTTPDPWLLAMVLRRTWNPASGATRRVVGTDCAKRGKKLSVAGSMQHTATHSTSFCQNAPLYVWSILCERQAGGLLGLSINGELTRNIPPARQQASWQAELQELCRLALSVARQS